MAYTEQRNFGIGIFNLEKHLGFIAIPFLFINMKINTKQRKIFLLVFALSCFLSSLVCMVYNVYCSIFEYNTLIHEWRFSHERLAEPLGISPIYFALYLSFSFFILLNYLFTHTTSLSKTKKVASAVILFYFLAFIVSLGARTVITSTVLALFVYMLIYARAQKSLYLFTLACLLPLLIGVVVFFNPIVKTRFIDLLSQNYEHSNYGGVFSRTYIWESGLPLIRDNFLLGVGTGDDQAMLDKKFVEDGFFEGVQHYNMHNQYLQSLLSNGLGALLIWLLVLLVQFINAKQKKDSLYFIFLFLFALSCMTESMLCTHKGIVFFIIFSCIFYKSESKVVSN